MSFYKYYPNRKDHRKTYQDSRAFCASCCNNKSCSYCRGNRLYQRLKAEDESKSKLREFMEESADYESL